LKRPISPNLFSLHVLYRRLLTHVYFPAEIDRVSGSRVYVLYHLYIQIIVLPTMVVPAEAAKAPD